jgi:hypothetical protein
MTKSNVIGLLALAVTSSIALAQDGGWSAKPGSGLKYDGGDAFGLNLKGQLQVHYVYGANETGADTSNFDIRRARTSLEGHVFNKNIHYKLMIDAEDAGTNSNVKQAWVQWNFMNSEAGTIGLRVGQAKQGLGLESTATSSGLYHVERSEATGEFVEQYSRGAWMNGKYMDSKLRWTLGAMNSTTLGEEAANDDNELGYVAAVNFDPLGDFFEGKQTAESWKQGDLRDGDRKLVGTVGLGYGMDNTVAGGVDVETEVLNLNTAWSVQGFQVMGEWFDRSAQPDGGTSADSDGFSLNANYTLAKSGDSAIQWGFGARYTVVDTSDLVGGDEVTDISLIANAFYHGHACKTQFEVTQREYDSNDDTDYIIAVAFQLLF